MADTGRTHEDKLGVLLGSMALGRGLITHAQLNQALSEQARDAAAGRRARPIGVILVARGFLTDRQLTALLDEQQTRILTPASAGHEATLLGGILVRRGLVSAAHVDECVRLQNDLREAGYEPVPRLGELLVQKGYATAGQVSEALAAQQKTILACDSCARRYNASRFDPARTYRCVICQTPLRALSAVDTVRVDESAVFEPPTVPPAAERPSDSTVGSETKRLPRLSPIGKYAVLRELGRGATGRVYEAFDRTLHRTVALKVMMTSPHADAQEAALDEKRFFREARLAAKLPKHAHIVGVYDTGRAADRRYIAMEFVRGRPMSEWRQLGSVTLREQVRLLRDTALAVHVAHEHGVVHRDLKPDNILVDDNNEPHVTDFGLAKVPGRDSHLSKTPSGIVVGTPHYMSPEQARGLPNVGRGADVYSLGAMLYEILAGRPPFEGRTTIETLVQVLDGRLVPPSQVVSRQKNPSLDETVERICLRALAREPAGRYATAKAFAEDLTRWLGGGAPK